MGVGHKGGGQLERQRQVDDGAEAIIEVGGVDGGKVGSVARNVTIACVCQQRELRMLRGVPVGLALPIGAEAPDDACRMRLPHLRGEVHAVLVGGLQGEGEQHLLLLEDRRGEMDVGRDGPVAVHVLWCGGGAPCVAIEGGHHRHIVIAPAPLHGHAQPLLRLKVVGVVGAGGCAFYVSTQEKLEVFLLFF